MLKLVVTTLLIEVSNMGEERDFGWLKLLFADGHFLGTTLKTFLFQSSHKTRRVSRHARHPSSKQLNVCQPVKGELIF